MIKKITNFINAKNLKLLKILTILAFISGFFSFFFLEFSWSMTMLTILMYYLSFGFGVSATFHRTVCHRSVIMNPWIETLGKFFAMMGGTGSTISWVMTHRAHHKYSDTDKDPHPPWKINKTLIGQYPKVGTHGLRRYADSQFNKFTHRYYFLILIGYGAMWGLIGGSEFFFYGFLYPACLTIMASNFVNKYSHSSTVWFNYRRFNTNDLSVNSPIVAILCWGEGWHNTHHRYPGRAKFSMSAWEVDFSYYLLQIFEKLKLAKIKPHSPIE
jgi:stearoyl-CoA desaturase (delta-9 desaturase)